MNDYGVKHIYELPLNNAVVDADSLVFDQAETGNSFRIQLRGLVEFLINQYVASRDLSNVNDEALTAFITRVAQATPGLVLKSHTNETQAGLGNLSDALINADAHRIADMFFENLTKEEFEILCKFLSGEIVRSSGTADGLLANKDLTNLSNVGKSNLNRVEYFDLEQTDKRIVIPENALGKCVRIKLNQDVNNISLPTSGLDSTALQQVIIQIDRNGFNITNDAFVSNGYTLRGTGASMPSFTATFVKDKAIEFYCEYDDFTNKENPTWNYGYSKIGH